MPTSAFGLNQATHEIVNMVAAQLSTPAQQSSLDSVLRDNLGLPDGLSQRLRGRPALDWIGEGGIREDDGIRFFRHFHDPLKPWARAGLGPASSSILWMQRPTDPTACQEWTWTSARCYFYRALSAPAPGDREQAWANTFRALGHLMHLVVDASVPEHTRSDPHPLGGLFGSYEYWVQSEHKGADKQRLFIATYLSNPIGPDASLLGRATSDAAAPVPVAHLLDADVYTGADPNVTLTSPIGIAEFSNANFFSENSGYRRFLAPTYPHPSVDRLVPTLRALPQGQTVRAYYKKGPGDGLDVDPVLAECGLDAAFRDDGLPTPQYKCTDKHVWQQTAAAMLPRAVGYAATLIDYFFRGFVPAGYEEERLRIWGSDEVMSGEFQLLYDTADGTRRPLASWTLRVDPNGVSDPLATPSPPPDAAPNARCWLVFRGQLGLEPDAVAASQVGCPSAPPPPPPPPGEWYVYYCTTFYAANNYFYATKNPPLWDFEPALVFPYGQRSTGTSFNCFLMNRNLTEPPPGSRTEHPA